MYLTYKNLKKHFDKLMLEPPHPSHVYDQIRSLYLEAFNTKIGTLDVFRTEIGSPINPIKNIITLVGEHNKEIPTGVMMDYNGIVFINRFGSEIFSNFNNISEMYIKSIIRVMDEIAAQDVMYKDLEFAKHNPYSMMLRLMPIYVAFHHIGTCKPHLLNDGIFEQIILNKAVVDTKEEADRIVEGLACGRYTDEPWAIFGAMSCNNTIKPFKSIKKDKKSWG